jgi:subtilisin family serine protease
MQPRSLRLLSLLALTVAAFLVFAQAAFAAGPPVRKIVRFRAGFVNAPARDALAKHGGRTIKELRLVGGASVYLPSGAAAQQLAKDPNVLSIEDDIVVKALKRPARGGGGTQPAQQLPWGVNRIDADLVWPLTTADPIKVGIIDTGIDSTHPDLVANIKGGVSEVSYTTSWNDDNGHGTHVAGITAAANNTIGVVGAAPNADLYAIKVLNRNGSGYLSDIISGLDWAVANGMQVVNMSLGTSTYSSSLDLACRRTAAAGVVEVAAAGNDGPYANSVDYPGACSGVIAVGATDSNNNIASFSSRGPQVAVSAPGVSIYSTYKGGGYSTLSGTSMASPHVTGSVALMLTQAPGAYDANADGFWQPAEVKSKLQATARDLGAAGFDNNFGAGLVRANLAVQP